MKISLSVNRILKDIKNLKGEDKSLGFEYFATRAEELIVEFLTGQISL